MSRDKRKYFRISPESLVVELKGKEVKLLNISLGGAKFIIKDIDDLSEQTLFLILDENNTLEIPFIEKERAVDVVRVSFLSMTPRFEAVLAKYIMDWQSKRAYLAKRKD